MKENHMINWKFFSFFLTSLLFQKNTFHATQIYSYTTIKQEPHITEIPYITIWIHGTQLCLPYIWPSFFYVPQGLHAATNLTKTYHHRLIAEFLYETDPEQFPLNHFYLFGWSGNLNFQARKNAAEILLTEIKKLIAEYEKIYSKIPHLCVITHSHGGNVVLNLAQLMKNNELKIDQLILLACPVQKETKHYIKSSIFKQVYSIYSHKDILQIIDPQGIYNTFEQPIFSERVFDFNENVIQFHLKINNKNLLHIEFLFQKCIQSLPKVIEIIECTKKQKNYTDSLLEVFYDTQKQECIIARPTN